MKKNNYKTIRKKRLSGTVVSDKNSKTRVVKVERTFRHPLYQKVLRAAKKYHVHDEKEISATGDLVTIEEMRPMSKLKRWRVLEVKK